MEIGCASGSTEKAGELTDTCVERTDTSSQVDYPGSKALQQFDGENLPSGNNEIIKSMRADDSHRCIDKRNDNFITGFGFGVLFGVCLTMAVVVFAYIIMPSRQIS
jgi:hypothetical protein